MNFDTLKKIENEEINKVLKSFCAANTELYLVGGYIRDLILEKPCYDRDYVIKGEKAINFAKKAADFFSGYLVILDKELDIARVVMPDKKNTLDFAGCFKQDIHEDLKRRDYTINALAYRLNHDETGLVDIFDGMNDIAKKVIRVIARQNLVDDPLRILRAFRFAAQLDFHIETETLHYIKEYKSLINAVSVERIALELLKMLESGHAAYNLNLMKEIYFLDEILPELTTQRSVPPNLHHHLSLIDHSIEVVQQVEINVSHMPEWVKERLSRDFVPGIKIISLLKLAALLHDLGKPSTWQIDELGRHRFIKHDTVGADLATDLLKRLRFSRNSAKYVTDLIKNHLYPSQLLKSIAEQGDTTSCEKAILRMFRKIKDETSELILLAMADRLSARGIDITDDIINNNIKGLYFLLEKYGELKEKTEIPKLINGKDVMEILQIFASPEVGKILKDLKEAQISGDINTKEEAIGFVKSYKFAG